MTPEWLSNAVALAGYSLIGVLIGVATLPGKRRMSPKGSTVGYLLVWACVWIYLVPLLFWTGLLAYRKAWRGYLDRHQAEDPKAQKPQDEDFPKFQAHQTFKEMYLKHRD